MSGSQTDSRFSWVHDGRKVNASDNAEVSSDFGQGTRYYNYVQEILDDLIMPGSAGLYVKTVVGFDAMPLRVIPVGNRKRWWGILKQHAAGLPEKSPFVKQAPPLVTNALTIEVRRAPGGGLELVRAYAGEKLLPLPWQSSARGMREESREFWRNNAFVYRPELVQGGLSSTAPEWYCETSLLMQP